jgi:hypothetical protein
LASDVLLARKAQDFVDSLTPDLREEWDRLIVRLLDDPFPIDGRSRELPFPYPPGMFSHVSGSFWLTFRLENAEVIWIAFADFWDDGGPYRSFTR